MERFTFYCIRAMMCFAPGFLLSQAPSKPFLPLTPSSPEYPLLFNQRQVADPHLLRLRNTGPMGDLGIDIELIPLSLVSTGPLISLDAPDPMVPRSGAIRLLPNYDAAFLKISNIGSSGQDGVALDLGEAVIPPYRPRLTMLKPVITGLQSALVVELGENTPKLSVRNIGSSGQDGVRLTVDNPPTLESFFDVFYDLSTAKETRVYGDALSDLSVVRTYDKATPKLLEKITSGSHFFDITYDLNFGGGGMGLGAGKVQFQDFHFTNVFDPSVPKLLQRVASDDPAYLDSFFDIYYDLEFASIGKGFGNNPDNLCIVTTFDPAGAILRDRISSGLASVESFFDIYVDLSLGTETRRLGTIGDPDFDLLQITTYDKSTPKLLERISSSDPMVESFFDVFVDLSLETETRRFTAPPGDPDFDLLVLREYDRATPKLLERIQSTNPLFADSFFDIYYDLELASIGKGFGNNPDNICAVTTFDPAGAILRDRISSGLSSVESFFDIYVDLSLGTETRRLGTIGDPDFDLLRITTYDKSTPKLLERILSSDPMVESFFDVFVDLSLETETRRFTAPPGDPDFDLLVLREYDRATPRLLERIQSTNPLYADSFFDITFDLDEGSHKRVYDDLELLETFHKTLPTYVKRLESTNPGFAGRYIETEMDIRTEMIPLHLTSAGFPGLQPLEIRYEYDGINRLIREVSVDESNGSTLQIERILLPTSSSLAIGGNLIVNNGVLLSNSGPLVVLDELQLDGELRLSDAVVSPGPGPILLGDDVLINGSLQVIGSKAFKIDHPLDPDNKYLIHNCIESPDMMNIYNGNAITDEQGYVTIQLPEYFEALNTDFRYQLTCIGTFAQAIVDRKVSNNQFVIRTDKPQVEVSWQVTGIRNDPASKRQYYAVEMEKEPGMKGKRLYSGQ